MFKDWDQLKSKWLIALITYNSASHEEYSGTNNKRKSWKSGIITIKPLNLDEDSEEEKKSKVSEKGKRKASVNAEVGLLPDIWNQIYRF